MKLAQQQRLQFMSELLESRGFVNRKDLVEKFDICFVQASVDIAKFIELNPQKMKYSPSNRRYERRPTA